MSGMHQSQHMLEGSSNVNVNSVDLQNQHHPGLMNNDPLHSMVSSKNLETWPVTIKNGFLRATVILIVLVYFLRFNMAWTLLAVCSLMIINLVIE